MKKHWRIALRVALKRHPAAWLAYRAFVAFRFFRRHRVIRRIREARRMRKQLKAIRKEMEMGKSLLESKTVWGFVGMALAAVLARFHLNLDADALGAVLYDGAIWVMGVGSFLWTLRGRIVAIIKLPPGTEVATQPLTKSTTILTAVVSFLNFAAIKLGFGPIDTAGAEQLAGDLVTYAATAFVTFNGIVSRLKATKTIAGLI